jgi:hypothetical protein
MNTQDLYTFQAHIALEMARAKENVVSQIMEKVTGRPANEIDAKDFEFITNEMYPGREFIGYKGNMLGELIWSQSTDHHMHTMTYTFEPKTSFAD